MLKKGSKVIVADNSGALIAEIISFPYGNSITRAFVEGHMVKVALKKVKPNNGKVKKGEVYKAVIIRTVSGVKEKGTCFTFRSGSNAVVLLTEKNTVLGTAVKGKVSNVVRARCIAPQEEIRKIFSISQGAY
jgi:large subunit ribosomal protein L14